MKSIVTLTSTLAIVISISTICSTYASPNEVYPQQTNHLRTQSRLDSQNEAIVRGDETEVSHRKLQPDNEDEVADLLEEVVDLLKETDTPTYSPTKPETEEPTSGMPTYSPTCEDDDCGKKDTPAPVAPDIVETTPPVPAPIITDPPVKEVEEDVVDPVEEDVVDPVDDSTGGGDTTGGDITDETTTDESDTTDKGGDDLNVSGAEGTTDSNKSNSLSGGATAGIVIGALAVAGLAAAGIVMAKKRRDAIPSSEDTQDLNSGFVETELVPPPPPPPPSALDSIMKKKQGAADESEEVDLVRSTSISWKPQPDIEQVQPESEF